MRTNVDVLRLSESPTLGEYERTVAMIDKQSTRMARLVDDLFALSAQGDFETRDTVDLDALLRDIVDQLGPAAADKHVTVTIGLATAR
jgi:signal transduction histidine kinase